jgi:hypothetical protein
MVTLHMKKTNSLFQSVLVNFLNGYAVILFGVDVLVMKS